MQPSEPMQAAFLPWPQTYAMYLRYSAIQLNRYWSSTTLPIGSFCCAASPRSLLSEQVVELRPHRQRAQFPRTSSGSLRKHLEAPLDAIPWITLHARIFYSCTSKTNGTRKTIDNGDDDLPPQWWCQFAFISFLDPLTVKGYPDLDTFCPRQRSYREISGLMEFLSIRSRFYVLYSHNTSG